MEHPNVILGSLVIPPSYLKKSQKLVYALLKVVPVAVEVVLALVVHLVKNVDRVCIKFHELGMNIFSEFFWQQPEVVLIEPLLHNFDVGLQQIELTLKLLASLVLLRVDIHGPVFMDFLDSPDSLEVF